MIKYSSDYIADVWAIRPVLYFTRGKKFPNNLWIVFYVS